MEYDDDERGWSAVEGEREKCIIDLCAICSTLSFMQVSNMSMRMRDGMQWWEKRESVSLICAL